MRGDRIHRGVWIGLLLSVVMHTGIGYVATSVTMGADRGENTRAGFRDGGDLTMDLPDSGQFSLPETDDPNLRKLEEMLAAQQPPPTFASPPAAMPPEREPKLVLGIEKSDQVTPNWLGSANPTEHLAKLSEVNQPQLDPNPGAPGSPGMGPTRPPMAEPIPSETTPTPPNRPASTPIAEPKQEPVKAREGDAQGHADVAEHQPARKGDVMGTGERDLEPPKAAPDPTKGEGALAGNPEKVKGIERPKDRPTQVAEKQETIKAIEPPKAVRPVEASPEPARVAAKPDASTPREPLAAKPSGAPAGASVPGEATGGGGDKPGTKSEKEADASSTTASIEVRPGQPAAAQGLDITTKRPNFTRLTRVVAYPERNPLFKVTFSARGVVTKVKMIESSGIKDVDEPVINAIYQWTAKGKALAELASEDPASGLTISVRILLR